MSESERRSHHVIPDENAVSKKQNGCVNNNNTRHPKPFSESLTRERLKALNKSSALDDGAASKDNRETDTSRRQVWKISKRLPGSAQQRKHMSSSRTPRATSATSNNVSFDDSVFYSPNYDEVLQTTRGLCRDYICYRLKRSGFQGRVVITKYEPAKDQNLSFDVLKMGKTLEDLYPHLFRNLARQLGYVLRSDDELRTLFDRLGTSIVGSNPAEYRWGRVLALLAIAGSLSVDCIAQGHTELVENMVTIFCDFIEVNLLSWIIEHGGWVGMAKLFSEKDERSQRVDRIVRNFGTTCVPVVCASALFAGMALVAGALLEVF